MMCLATALVSCQDKKHENYVPLHADTTVACDDSLLNVQKIMTLGNGRILAFTNTAEPFASIIDIKTGAIMRRTLHNGEGPGEYIWPRLAKGYKDNRVCISDLSSGKISIVDIEADSTVKELNTSRYGTVDGVVNVSDGRYVVHMQGTEKRFGIIENDSMIRTFDIPYPCESNISPTQAAIVYQGGILGHPYENKIVHYSRYGKVLELFEYDLGKCDLHRYAAISETGPRYWGETDEYEVSGRLKPDNTIGFTNGCATESAIYLLFSGKRMNDPNVQRTDIIEVYDWNGEHMCSYKLDKPLTDIAVHNDSLIGIGESDERYHISVYNLNIDHKSL